MAKQKHRFKKIDIIVQTGFLRYTQLWEYLSQKHQKHYGFLVLLNGLWSILFFRLKNPELAFIEIVLLLASIIYYTQIFYRIRPLTAGCKSHIYFGSVLLAF